MEEINEEMKRGHKTRDSLIKKYGENHYKKLGAQGGQVLGVKKGFALRTPEERREFGRIGGRKSKK